MEVGRVYKDHEDGLIWVAVTENQLVRAEGFSMWRCPDEGEVRLATWADIDGVEFSPALNPILPEKPKALVRIIGNRVYVGKLYARMSGAEANALAMMEQGKYELRVDIGEEDNGDE